MLVAWVAVALPHQKLHDWPGGGWACGSMLVPSCHLSLRPQTKAPLLIVLTNDRHNRAQGTRYNSGWNSTLCRLAFASRTAYVWKGLCVHGLTMCGYGIARIQK